MQNESEIKTENKEGEVETLEDALKVIEEQKILIEKLRQGQAILNDKLEERKKRMERTLKKLGQAQLKIFEVEDDEITSIGETLGEGGFGVVKSAVWERKRTVAIKDISLINTSQEVKDAIVKEFQSQVGLAHPNVLRIYGYSMPSPDVVRMIMEKMDMDLAKYNMRKKPTIGEKIDLMKEMVECVHFLHDQEPLIIHRDIKGMNFLVSEDGKQLKICDFGMVKTKTNSQTYVKSKVKGSGPYIAPEVMEKQLYSLYSDIYALGICFWELLYCDYPLKHIQERNLVFRVTQDDVRPKFSKPRLPKGLKRMRSLIKKMWAKDPKKRPNTSQLRSWFKNFEGTIKSTCGEIKFP